jgi:hypothetical protein
MRYEVRKQDDGEYWCVWDTETDEPAKTRRFRYVNLQYDEAVEEADALNRTVV